MGVTQLFITYKPGWTFTWKTYDGLSPSSSFQALEISFPSTCIDSGEPIDIKRELAIPDKLLNPTLSSDLQQLIADTIISMEEHEIAEHLKFNSIAFYDNPHAEDQ